MYDYYKVFTQTQPLRDKLAAMLRIKEEKMALLKRKKEELDTINRKLQLLNDEYLAKVAYKEKLQADIELCQIKLERAKKLTGGLSGEKGRWGMEIEKLQASELLIPGDSIISAGVVAYSGPFISTYR